jgi:phosphoribosylanthranilate isomerase
MSLKVKICGLSTPETVDAALDAGADLIGFVFHPKSPRFVSLEQASALARRAKGRAETVALLVDADDELISNVILEMRPDCLQLHGKETPGRVAEIEDQFFIRCIKAVGLSEAPDINTVRLYHERQRTVLLDAKPPKDAAYPGGHGKVFDWSILAKMPDDIPFLLSGGLDALNVGEAIAAIDTFNLAFAGVDVSSGVESAPGLKDIAKIKAFVAAARQARNKGQFA